MRTGSSQGSGCSTGEVVVGYIADWCIGWPGVYNFNLWCDRHFFFTAMLFTYGRFLSHQLVNTMTSDKLLYKLVSRLIKYQMFICYFLYIAGNCGKKICSQIRVMKCTSLHHMSVQYFNSSWFDRLALDPGSSVWQRHLVHFPFGRCV